MLPYLLVFSFVMAWIRIEKKSLNRTSLFLPFVTLSLFAGVRSYKVGTDSGNYVRYFVNDLSVYNYSFNDDIEYGYQLIEYILLNFTHNYFWLFFLTALIIIPCYLYIIKKYSVDYWLSMFFYLTLGSYIFFFNGLRQGLAIAVCVLALPFLLDKKFIKFMTLVVLAFTLHNTALFLIPFYFLVNSNLKLANKIALSFLTSLALSKLLVTYVSDLNPRYEGYKKVSEESGGYLVLGFYVILLVLIYFIIYRYKIKDEFTLKLFSYYSAGVVFIIPIALLGSSASGPQRLLSYFSWTLILLLPIAINKTKNNFIYMSAIFFSIIYFILTTSRFSNLSPYILNPTFKVF